MGTEIRLQASWRIYAGKLCQEIHCNVHYFFFQAEDGIRDYKVTGFQTCALPISTVNERDWPAGGAPPDYVTEVRHRAAYGWPQCFAQGRAFLRDPTFDGPGGCRAMKIGRASCRERG